MKYVTIHHIKNIDSYLHFELRYGDQEHPTLEQFKKYYEPAETIRGTSNINEVFHHAQGETVNEQQNARHMVHSSMPTDVYEVHEDDDVEFYMVEPVGFVQIDWNPKEI